MLEGKVWMFGDDINTDLIAPTPYIYMPAKDQANTYSRSIVQAGSTRSKPVTLSLRAAISAWARAVRLPWCCGSSARLAVYWPTSINALFFRNCVSFGLFALECPGVSSLFERDREPESPSRISHRESRTGGS